MQDTVLSQGTVVRHPLRTEVTDWRPDSIEPFRVGPASGAERDEPDDWDPVPSLLTSLLAQQLSLQDAFVLEPADGMGPLTVDDSEPLEVEVRLEGGERAVMLVETDGALLWLVPEERSHGASMEHPHQHGAVFRVPLTHRSAGEDPAGEDPVGPMWVGGEVYRLVRGFVLKYVAGLVADKLKQVFEGGVTEGLVGITGPDPEEWAAPKTWKVPADARKVLLLIHGTFSSTKGCYGALGATPEGRAFLDEVLKKYDVVLGYDHRTLSLDPQKNADDLLRCLLELKLPAGTAIDAVAHSRGGLVLRSFSERTLSRLDPDGRFSLKKAVLVGCPLGGTALAERDNWRKLLDLMTNLAAGLGRLVGRAFPVAGVLVEESIKTLGTLVFALADHGLDGENVPGLASMVPDGEFIRELNEAPVTDAAYYAVTSNFDLNLADLAPGLNRGVTVLLADRLADGFMRVDNDLVVDTVSMTYLGVVGLSVAGALEFGPGESVYHTVYFLQPLALEALDGWLHGSEVGEVNAY